MNRSEITDRFDCLNTWASGHERACHKPLLVLYSLGCWRHGQVHLPFAETVRPLTELLTAFGPPRKVQHPEYPFWRLQHDGVWTVIAPITIDVGADGGATKGELMRCGAHGCFAEDVQAALRDDPSLVGVLATRLLQAHFEALEREAILQVVGLVDLDDSGASATGQR